MSRQRTDIQLALLHHPINWLREEEDPELKRLFGRDYQFILHGHEHQEWVEENGDTIIIAAGACYEHSRKANGYNFVRIDLASSTGEVFLRHYHQAGGWIPEVVPGKTNNDGRWKLKTIPRNQIISEPKQVVIIAVDRLSSDKLQRTFVPYGSDLPPVVEAWVGRAPELADLHSLGSGVAVVTGIGGQGKSALVAKHLEEWRSSNPSGFWDWRDCREEGERFHTQLVAIIEHLTEGRVTGADLSRIIGTDIESGDIKTLIRYFFELLGDRKALIILDNVDHYTNYTEKIFTHGIDIFTQEAVRVKHQTQFILTCRPRITYPSPRYLEISLDGLTYDEAEELFTLKGLRTGKHIDEIMLREVWTLTSGHPLWLNLIAVQISRNPDSGRVILDELRKGKVDDRAQAMLRALWKSLTPKQHTILRCMAELSFPEDSETIHQMIKSTIKTSNQFNRAFSALVSLSLVVVRKSREKVYKYDLHPLIRNFVRAEYSTSRKSVIAGILPFFLRTVRKFEGHPRDIQNDLLERWAAMTELQYLADQKAAALMNLSAIRFTLIGRGLHEEFIRIARNIVDDEDWHSSNLQGDENFHNIVDMLVRTLAHFNRSDEARSYFDRYKSSVAKGTLSYLRLCICGCFFEWLLGNYDEAITWGKAGETLKRESHMDTAHDAKNDLALALRDGGYVDEAMSIFFEGESVASALSSNHRELGKRYQFFGNIGRCFYLKGDRRLALEFYLRSADLLRDSTDASDLSNLGYATLWIGQALVDSGDLTNGFYFLRFSEMLWAQYAPLNKSLAAKTISDNKVDTMGFPGLSNEKLENHCLNWIVSKLAK